MTPCADQATVRSRTQSQANSRDFSGFSKGRPRRLAGAMILGVMPIAAGTRIGPYEIVGWLGAGGMGEVYRARDPRLGRDVAIKLIPESFADRCEPVDVASSRRRAPPDSSIIRTSWPSTMLDRTPARRTSSRSCSRANRCAAVCREARCAPRKATRLRAADCGGARRRARQRHRPPRREARESLHHERRADQDSRLRHRQADAAERRRGSATVSRPRRRRGWWSARRATCRRSRFAAKPSTPGPTSSASARSCTRCSPAARHSRRATAAETMAAILKEDPPDAAPGARPAGTRADRRRAASRNRARRGFSRRAIWRSPWSPIGDQTPCHVRAGAAWRRWRTPLGIAVLVLSLLHRAGGVG